MKHCDTRLVASVGRSLNLLKQLLSDCLLIRRRLLQLGLAPLRGLDVVHLTENRRVGGTLRPSGAGHLRSKRALDVRVPRLDLIALFRQGEARSVNLGYGVVRLFGVVEGAD